jgi:redox-sensitive bicupin YhaK (pirin superfamily)
MPVHRAPGVEARLYSGRSNGLMSATQNYVPVTLVDVSLEPGGVFEQELPASYDGFLLPITGAVLVDGEKAPLARGEMGWFGRADEEPLWLRLTADEEPARVLLYAGARQGEPTVHYGPFVAGSMAGIEGMYRDCRRGRFPKSSEL